MFFLILLFKLYSRCHLFEIMLNTSLLTSLWHWFCVKYKDVSSMQYRSIGTFWPLQTYFATWVIFWSEHIETSLNKNCVMFCLKYLNQFSIKTWSSSKYDPDSKICSQGAKFFISSIMYTTDTQFYNSSINIGSISYFSSSDMQQFHHLLGCHAIAINFSLNSFLSA